MEKGLELFKSRVKYDIYLNDFIETFKNTYYAKECELIEDNKMESINLILNDMDNKLTMLYFELEKDILKINDILEG